MSKWTVMIQKTNTQCKMISVSGPETAESAVVAALNAMEWTAHDCISVTAEVADENASDAPTTIDMATPEPIAEPSIDHMEDSAPPRPTARKKAKSKKK